MNQHKWKVYGAWILLVEAVGGLSGWLTREGARQYSETIAQPPLSPPAIVCPIVWGILFLLMGIGAARLYLSPPSANRTRSLLIFLIQLGFNFFWSIIFFGLSQYLFAFLWLLALIILIGVMIYQFYQISPAAAYLQIPYIVWCIFAAYLNFMIYIMNK